MAKALPQIEEGYIVCDANHNRIKVKNPAYVALHHLKSKLCKEELFTVIRRNLKFLKRMLNETNLI